MRFLFAALTVIILFASAAIDTAAQEKKLYVDGPPAKERTNAKA